MPAAPQREPNNDFKFQPSSIQVPTRKKNTMSNLANAFGSFLKHADLAGEAILLTIERCEFEQVGQGQSAETKPVLHFEGNRNKPMVLNKTNSDVLIDAFGPETDDFPGKVIEAFPTKTDYQGRRVDCIRLRVPESTPF